MSKHGVVARYRDGVGRSDKAMETSGPLLGRTVIIGIENVRQVMGRHLEAGLILASGVILEVTHNHIDGEARLEMVGANIHYVDHDEPILVLGAVDLSVLDGISAGEFVRRKET